MSLFYNHDPGSRVIFRLVHMVGGGNTYRGVKIEYPLFYFGLKPDKFKKVNISVVTRTEPKNTNMGSSTGFLSSIKGSPKKKNDDPRTPVTIL